MSDIDKVDVKTGEVVDVVVKSDDVNMLALVKDADKGVYQAMASMDSLNWRNLKPNQTALLLCQKPFPVSGGGTMYLNFKQALLFAVRCYELELSPFSSAVWFDPNRNTVNLTLEGKRELARIKGIDLGPPMFEELTREWKDVRKSETGDECVKAGFPKDLGYRCKIRVGKPEYKEYAEYTAWLSEWYVSRSPVWKAKASHMLQTRATEKTISLAMGTGASDMVGSEPDDK